MPAENPMAEVIDFGGGVSANAGPVKARVAGGLNVGNVDDHHVSALLVLLALALLFGLWKSNFRFNMTVGR